MTSTASEIRRETADYVDVALSRIRETINRLESQTTDPPDLAAGLARAATARMLRQFTADMHASRDGRLAAMDNGRTWVVVDTGSGQSLPANPNATPEQIDIQLAKLAQSDIPWGDGDAMRNRWSDPQQRSADQQTVRKILSGDDIEDLTVMAEVREMFRRHEWSSGFGGVCVDCSQTRIGEDGRMWCHRDDAVPWPCPSIREALIKAGMPVQPPTNCHQSPRILGDTLSPADNAKALGHTEEADL